jgi:hypothetical protein
MVTSGSVVPHSQREMLWALTPKTAAACSWVMVFASRSRRKFLEKSILFAPFGCVEASGTMIANKRAAVHIAVCERTLGF